MPERRFRPAAVAAVVGLYLVALAAPPARANLQIVIQPGSGLAANADALAAFNRAADEWTSHITTDASIYIQADLADMGSTTIIGSTNPVPDGQWTSINKDYTTVRDAMAARAARPGNAIMAYLPTTAQVVAKVPSNGTFDNTTLGITRANQKALGLLTPADPSYTNADGAITFNTGFSFAYNRSDLAVGKMDFQTVAAHEIGHVLGFLSDVDDFDGTFPPTTLNDNLTTLDLFRFATTNKPTDAATFTTTPRELEPGVESVTSDTTVEYPMSTGYYQGDGHQAAHWKDDAFGGPLVGIMDPTLDYNTIESVMDSDLRAMELIGYDTTPLPEPAGLALVAGAATVLLARRHDSRDRRSLAMAA